MQKEIKMKKLLFIVLFSLLNINLLYADTISHTVVWGSGNRCSAMCGAYRAQATAMCQEYGYNGGRASSCNCNEGGNAPDAYGNLECTGKLNSEFLAVPGRIKLKANERCSAATVRFDKLSQTFCNNKGYRVGQRSGPVHCDEIGGKKSMGYYALQT